MRKDAKKALVINLKRRARERDLSGACSCFRSINMFFVSFLGPDFKPIQSVNLAVIWKRRAVN